MSDWHELTEALRSHGIAVDGDAQPRRQRGVGEHPRTALRPVRLHAGSHERLVIHDHHPGYLTWEQYQANQAKLAANRSRQSLLRRQ